MKPAPRAMGSPSAVSVDAGERLTVCMLASGSRGNAIYVSNGRAAILLDAGLSGIEIERRLCQRQLNPRKLDAIVVSHEHADHVKGVGVLSRRFDLPVYLSNGTKAVADAHIGRVCKTIPFSCGQPFTINGLCLSPFSTSHDADDPAGFTIRHHRIKVGIATDLGQATTLVKSHLCGCHLLILEANHDPDMLINGPYPWPLKQRIKSRTGHLSNQDTGRLLKALMHAELQKVVLAHLSQTNNSPERALSTIGCSLNRTRIPITVATQDQAGELIEVTIAAANPKRKGRPHDRRKTPIR